MEFDIRPVGDDDMAAFTRAVGAPFGVHPSDEMVAVTRSMVEVDRTLAVVDRGSVVAGAASLSFELTLPGLNTVPAAAVTEVGVLPTHRRRGMLTALMRRQLDDAAGRGEPVAVLLASESAIYGRFGYGTASTALSVEIETVHAGLVRSPETRGRLRLLDGHEATAVLPTVYDRYRRVQPGEVSRTPGWWDAFFVDPELFRGGATARFAVVYEDAGGDPTGYVTYRLKHEWLESHEHDLLVEDLVAVTPEARAALWRYCLTSDLVRTVRAANVPVDDALPWTMADPRRFAVTGLYDKLWLRLVDVPTALATRRYPVAGALVFEVADRFRPGGGGRWRIEGGPEGAGCRADAGEPDLALEVADLGAAYLGGVRFSTLARAGRVVELCPGALARADAMFASAPLPWSSTDF